MRAAIGARLARWILVELGSSAFALGGSLDDERLAQMTLGDARQLPSPGSVVAAGEARGLVDASVGLTF